MQNEKEEHICQIQHEKTNMIGLAACAQEKKRTWRSNASFVCCAEKKDNNNDRAEHPPPTIRSPSVKQNGPCTHFVRVGYVRMKCSGGFGHSAMS